MNKQQMREAMPQTADFIDRMREVFGAEVINPSLQAGMRGTPGFFAIESGHVIGTLDTSYRWLVLTSKRGNSYSIEADWIYWARMIGRMKGELLPQLDSDGSDADNHKIAARARTILATATPDEMYSATMIDRDDYQ